MTPTRSRPRVICHMVSSIDGRIIPGGWPDGISVSASRQYEQIHASYSADAWGCGRITMEPFAKAMRSAEEVDSQQGSSATRDDFSAPGDFDSFAVAFDPQGKLAWESNEISGDHVIAVVTQQVSDEYLQFLRSRDVSYIIAGDTEIDFDTALERLASSYAVETLMLEGGGRINGAMLRADLIDELSILIAPVADGRIGLPTLFDIDEDEAQPVRLQLKSIEQRPDDVLWIRYRPD